MSRAFTDIIREINGGAFADELTEELSDLILACRSTGKSGELTLKIKLKPGKAQAPTMTVLHDLKVKAPEFERPEQYFYVTGNNSLLLNNPNQGKLDLRAVQTERGELRETVDTDTGEIRPVATA